MSFLELICVRHNLKWLIYIICALTEWNQISNEIDWRYMLPCGRIYVNIKRCQTRWGNNVRQNDTSWGQNECQWCLYDAVLIVSVLQFLSCCQSYCKQRKPWELATSFAHFLKCFFQGQRLLYNVIFRPALNLCVRAFAVLCSVYWLTKLDF